MSYKRAVVSFDAEMNIVPKNKQECEVGISSMNFKSYCKSLTVRRELHIRYRLCVLVNNVIFMMFFDIPLDDVSVLVTGDELLVKRPPNHGRDFGTTWWNGNCDH